MLAVDIAKPRCQLPPLLTTSHLIGNVVMTLRSAGKKSESDTFIEQIKMNIDQDYQSIVMIGRNYVDFFD
jgi:hypothetical protein